MNGWQEKDVLNVKGVYMTKEPITVRIEPEIWIEVRKRALDLKMSAGSFVETAILRFLRSYSEKDFEDGNNVRK